jgi:hypothetical protein
MTALLEPVPKPRGRGSRVGAVGRTRPIGEPRPLVGSHDVPRMLVHSEVWRVFAGWAWRVSWWLGPDKGWHTARGIEGTEPGARKRCAANRKVAEVATASYR